MSFFKIDRFFIQVLLAFLLFNIVRLETISDDSEIDFLISKMDFETTDGIQETSNESRLLQGRIVNGTRARLNQFPYQVSLRKTLSGDHFCGGNIIDNEWIVTAAHCMFLTSGEQLQPWQMIVVAGEIWLNRTSITGQRSRVKQMIIHEEWNSTTYENDVTLLKLAQSFTFRNTAVQPQVLTTTEVPDGTICQVAGWGYPDQNVDTLINELTYIDVPIVNKNLCRKLLKKSSDIPDGMICAGYMEGLRDACQGDSGGGLICDGILAGIVSWGDGCAAPRLPGVYTDVKHYRNWILERSGIDYRSSGSGETSGTSEVQSFICPNLLSFVVITFTIRSWEH